MNSDELAWIARNLDEGFFYCDKEIEYRAVKAIAEAFERLAHLRKEEENSKTTKGG